VTTSCGGISIESGRVMSGGERRNMTYILRGEESFMAKQKRVKFGKGERATCRDEVVAATTKAL
jgi:hypothetical protein